MKKLWVFKMTFYDVHSGLVIATDEEIDEITGVEINFGELEGKHSEIIETIERDMFTEITSDEKVINMLRDKEALVGVDPFDHWEEEE